MIALNAPTHLLSRTLRHRGRFFTHKTGFELSENTKLHEIRFYISRRLLHLSRRKTAFIRSNYKLASVDCCKYPNHPMRTVIRPTVVQRSVTFSLPVTMVPSNTSGEGDVERDSLMAPVDVCQCTKARQTSFLFVRAYEYTKKVLYRVTRIYRVHRARGIILLSDTANARSMIRLQSNK